VRSQQFAEGDASSYDFGQTVLDVSPVDAATVRVALASTSLQAPDKGPKGNTCDNWTLEYTMVQSGVSSWLIDATQPLVIRSLD
jgi:hypothetical protein